MKASEYLAGLAQTNGVSEEDKAVLLKIAANEQFGKALEGDVLRQADYSRSMDKLREDQQKTTTYYQELIDWKAGVDRDLAAKQPNHAAAVSTAFDPTALRKEFADQMTARDGQFIGLLKTGMSLASRHAVEFKEPLDVDAIEKIATEKKINLQQAYDDFVSPRRQAASDESFKAKLAAARDEGARDALSKHKIPVDAKPRDYHFMMDRDPKKQVGADDYKPNSGEQTPAMTRQLRDNFAETWNNAASSTGGS